MTNTKHTPAPWYFEPYSDERGTSYGYVIGARKLRSIAVTTGKAGSCLQDENEANARLIAAAPELLAALQAYQAHYNAMETFPHSVNHPYELAKAAITRATQS